jgi:DNA-binding NtrC family response regulator
VAGKRVLVVDDDPSIATLVAEVLRDEGLQAKAVTNVREAAALIDQATPEVVLLDVNLPGLDGRDLLRQWLPLTASGMRVLLMTGDRRAIDQLDDPAALGVVGQLLKPFELQDLLDAVRRALDGARLGASPSHRCGPKPAPPETSQP